MLCLKNMECANENLEDVLIVSSENGNIYPGYIRYDFTSGTTTNNSKIECLLSKETAMDSGLCFSMDETHKGFVFVKVSEKNIIMSVKHLLKESDDKKIHGSRSYNIWHLEGVEVSALFVVIVCLNQDKVLLPCTVDFFGKAGDDKVHGFVKLELGFHDESNKFHGLERQYTIASYKQLKVDSSSLFLLKDVQQIVDKVPDNNRQTGSSSSTFQATAKTNADTKHGMMFGKRLLKGSSKFREVNDSITISKLIATQTLQSPSVEQKDNAKNSDISVDAFVGIPLSLDDFKTLSDLFSCGIESSKNSSYIDGTIFSLFSSLADFDNLLTASKCPNISDERKHTQILSALNTLKYRIVSTIRKKEVVTKDTMELFRVAFAALTNDLGYLESTMDAETFLNDLFGKLLYAQPFFQLNEDTEDYTLQLFWMGDKLSKYQRLSNILREYLSVFDVQFQNMPHPGLIIKLPVSNGQRAIEWIFPDLELDLADFVKKEGTSSKLMDLRVVICLEQGQFSTYVRAPSNDWNSSRIWGWIHFDSFSETPILRVDTMEADLKEIDTSPHPHKLERDLIPRISTLLLTAYICIYIPRNTSTVLKSEQQKNI